MKKSERVTLTEEEAGSLIDRLLADKLFDLDKTIIVGIIKIHQLVHFSLQEARTSIKRLQAVFGVKTEKRRHLNIPPLPPEDASGEETGKSLTERATTQMARILNTAVESLKKTKKKIQQEKIKGHGRLSPIDYPGASIVEQNHESLKAGDGCPEACGGKLYSIDPRVTICLTGHALATAVKYIQEKLRCSLCGMIFTAAPPAGMPTQKYDEPLKANLAIAKNYAGMPYYRLEKLQNMVGVPLPHATQWQCVESLADDIYPIYCELERSAAQGDMVCYDDTSVTILSCVAENKANPERKRKGTFTTGIVARFCNHLIYLFISGRLHAGENITRLFTHRFPGLEKLIKMSDALSSNLSSEFVAIVCLCLAHGRRKFYEIYDYFPGECRIVIDTLALIYHYDGITKKEQMNPEDRLKYHQTHSAPLMTVLHTWMTFKLEKNEVEPNSSLGKALKYMLKHWEGLTRFLHVPGCLLDNTITERALKIPIRSRKNSLFYKTEYSALVGSILTSIIHTCVMAEENPVDYLIALQKNRIALRKRPQDWLPWTYKETLNQHSPPSSPVPSCLPQPLSQAA